MGKSTAKELSVGKKIRKTRNAKKITLTNLANETGLSTELLKKLESEEHTPSVGMLLQISKALAIDSGALLQDETEAMEKRVEAYEKRTENYAYQSLTPNADHKHLKAFRIIIEPNQAHRGVGYCHEGEEFVYVLRGTVAILVGENKNILKPFESLHFNSGIKHHMTNIGDEKAELIVIVYSP